ncbi:uncharacterized protein FOMMEDRAFT_162167 [Fomitiporia mediterranea MF3/22]|uniref:uncharacterized protein n=1 Tax=Fomitiporia mediterranea (strain MF3/22) TaxID=694068 RepID=UPI00044093A0|nr:uncharacterized protein FOMMEDRAFT_162167 [Fomitiporia mediterranea MF3/22]EJC97832.1 hypothetical protein FOMMEDRAFT_162167 [Fomitiporia mediterranea MF3/22]
MPCGTVAAVLLFVLSKLLTQVSSTGIEQLRNNAQASPTSTGSPASRKKHSSHSTAKELSRDESPGGQHKRGVDFVESISIIPEQHSGPKVQQAVPSMEVYRQEKIENCLRGDLYDLINHYDKIHSKKGIEDRQKNYIKLLREKREEIRRELKEMREYNIEDETNIVRETDIKEDISLSKRQKPKERPPQFSRTGLRHFENKKIQETLNSGRLNDHLDLFFGIDWSKRIIESYDKKYDDYHINIVSEVVFRPGADAWGPCIFDKTCTSMSGENMPTGTRVVPVQKQGEEIDGYKRRIANTNEYESAKPALHKNLLKVVIDHFNKHHKEKADKSQTKMAEIIRQRFERLEQETSD